MPRGDGTGPLGRGPMTGKGMGPCAGNRNAEPESQSGLFSRFGNMFNRFGSSDRGQGRGRGSGQGRGTGRNNR